MVEPRVFAGLDDVLARAVERGEPPFILVLDSLEDPQNVGTLLRSAEAAGVHGVLFPTHRQAPLSPAAIKASAGAVEHLLLCPVDDLAGALSDLRIRGLRVAAAEADAPLTTAQADLRGPLAIVVGSEGQGLSPLIRRRADVAVRIPMRGAIGSLNAAVAGSILLFSAVAQRDPAGEGSEGRPRPASFDELVDAATAAGTDAGGSGATPAPAAAKPGRKPRKGLTTQGIAEPAIDGPAPTDPSQPPTETASEEPAPGTSAQGNSDDEGEQARGGTQVPSGEQTREVTEGEGDHRGTRADRGECQHGDQGHEGHEGDKGHEGDEAGGRPRGDRGKPGRGEAPPHGVGQDRAPGRERHGRGGEGSEAAGEGRATGSRPARGRPARERPRRGSAAGRTIDRLSGQPTACRPVRRATVSRA